MIRRQSTEPSTTHQETTNMTALPRFSHFLSIPFAAKGSDHAAPSAGPASAGPSGARTQGGGVAAQLARLRTRRRVASAVLGLVLGVVGVLPAAASAATIWNLGLHHAQTNFAPGSLAQYWVDVDNVGDTPSSGTVTVTLTLPPGMTRDALLSTQGAQPWSCPGAPGDVVFTCTRTTPIPRHSLSREPLFSVKVAKKAEGELLASAKVEGGGAANVATAAEPTQISPEPAGFGIIDSTFVPDFFKADGLSEEREAGAHPDLLTTPFDFNTVDLPAGEYFPDEKVEAGSVRDLHVDLPPGFIGNPTAVSECTQAQFTVGRCPPSSQVGRIDLRVFPYSNAIRIFTLSQPVFNLSHPRGVISDLAFVVLQNPVHIKATLDAANRYAVTTTVPQINESLPPYDQKLTLWGVPANKSHDSERCHAFSAFGGGDTSEECPAGTQAKPFLTLPSQCESPNTFRLHHYDSWQQPGLFGPEIDYTMPGKITNCDRPRFEPDVAIVPTGHQANAPTGLDIHVKIAQNENPNALATPPVRSTTVTLPQGMSFSPSFADGLRSCTEAQMRLETNDPIECPDASRIGEVTLSTPLLPKPAEGSMYLAAQADNPFHSLFALYLVLHDTEERGALIKIPGKIEVDEQTGQITTVFNDTPQFPFEDLTLKFRSGPRAPLVNPPSCGTQTIGVQLTSYAQPEDPVDVSNTYQITEGPNGTPCPPDSAHRPFTPKFSGGTLNPVAGSYSTFLFRLSREDQEQELSQVNTVLPPGLLAKIAGVPFCSDAAIASISTELGAGAAEKATSSCPAASQIGTVSAGLGAGPGPNYFPGKVYLSGPYKGAPLSLAIVVPALAGPYDLGNTVVRTALHVDPDTSRVTAVSDPFPTILHGVILRVRDVRLRVDRPETTLNPTNCELTSLDAAITGVGGNLLSTADDFLFNASDRFQVGDCGRIGFKPKLFFMLKGGTHRSDTPAFFSRLRARPGDANIGKAIVALPHSEFLDQAHIRTICTRVQFAADQCPPGSVYGHAKAITPLLDDPVEGDVILRSSNHPLPDLVARLRGQISANLIGRIDSRHGGIRTSFETVPDVPVTEFILTMNGGKKGLLENSVNLCKAPHRAQVRFTAQNGKVEKLHPLMQNGCKTANKGKKHKGAHRRQRRRG
jgi:uncharacterized repeat protein (TIGR01451 family)